MLKIPIKSTNKYQRFSSFEYFKSGYFEGADASVSYPGRGGKSLSTVIFKRSSALAFSYQSSCVEAH